MTALCSISLHVCTTTQPPGNCCVGMLNPHAGAQNKDVPEDSMHHVITALWRLRQPMCLARCLMRVVQSLCIWIWKWN